MPEKTIVAVPSNGPGGLEAERSGHFGRCDCFTLLDVEDGAVVGVRTIENPPHVEGGCLRPVGILAAEGVSSIIVVGIGGRPLAGFNEAGIAVYADNERPLVGEVAEALLAGALELVDPGNACGGH